MTTSPMPSPKPAPGAAVPAGEKPASESAKGAAAKGAGDSKGAGDIGSTRDRVVLLMMALITAAFGGMMKVQFGFTLPASVLAGGGLWTALMVLHLLAKRGGEIARLRNEVARLEMEVARGGKGALFGQRAMPAAEPKPAAAPSPAAPAQAAAAQAAPAQHDQRRSKALAAPTTAVAPAAPVAAVAAAHVAAPTVSERPKPAPQPDAAPNFNFNAETSPLSSEARWEASNTARRTRLTRSSNETEPAHPNAAAPAKPAPAMPDFAAMGETALRDPPAAPIAQQRPDPAPSAGPGLIDVPSWSGTAAATSDPLRDAWAFRPRDAADTRAFAPDAPGRDTGLRAPPPRTIEADLEMVQRKIKALADEVNAAESLRALEPVPAPSGLASGPAGNVSPSLSVHGPAIDDSIAALKTTADRMRNPGRLVADPQASFTRAAQAPPRPQPQPAEPATNATPGGLLSLDSLIPATAEPIAVSAPSPARAPEAPASAVEAEQAAPAPAAPAEAPASRLPRRNPVDKKVAEIAAAIEQRRMEVYLNPIVGLGDYAVTHFEVMVRLRSAHGEIIDQPEQTLTLAGDDILSLFDIERLNRASEVAAQLEARGKTGALLSATLGRSMSDSAFLEAFVQTFDSRNSISGQLVLTFTQADVSTFGSGAWQALGDMHAFGFRFALDAVTHLDMDFPALAHSGFAFVKLPADVFLQGLADAHGFVPPSDICRHLAQSGLTLVVGSVNDDTTLGRVFGFGALFGQGQLFGGSRQIALDKLPRQSAA